MTAGKRTAPALAVRCHRGERVKDEVYRQMFRLEESRPGAGAGPGAGAAARMAGRRVQCPGWRGEGLADQGFYDLPGDD